MRKSKQAQKINFASVVRNSELPFSLSWTHYIQIIKIDNEDERNFYEIEATLNN